MSAGVAIPDSVFARQFEQVARSPDGIARLRELITTLAIQGKLVPQDSSEHPAADLLKAIAEEIDGQVADGRVKRAKPMPEFGDPCPFEIPDSWAWVPMGQLVEIVRGITFPASEKTRMAAPGWIACLRTTNIQGTVEWDDLLFVDRKFVGREDQLLKLHDIVMSMANSRELVGKVALVDHIPHEEASFGGFLSVLRPWLVEPRYVMSLLRSPYARSSLIESSSQTTNIANVSLGKLRPLPFPLPPLREQARIVARVEELMRLCDALEAKGRLEAEQHARLLSTLLGTLTESRSSEELAANWQRVATHFDLLLDRPEAVDALEQTILQLAVRGLLMARHSNEETETATSPARPLVRLSAGSAEEVPFEIPVSWTWIRLADLAPQFQNGAASRGDVGGAPVIVLRLADIKQRRVSLADTRQLLISRAEIQKYSLRKGDILVTRVNGSADIVGQFNLVDGDIDAIYCDHFIRMRIDPDLLNPEFCALVGESDLVRAQIKRLFISTAGQKTVNQGHLGSLSFALPPLPEQRKIVARVTELRRLCADLRQRLSAQQTTQSHLAEALVEQAIAA